MEYSNGKIINAVVTGIEKYGIFVSVDEQYSGLIHISEISSKFVRSIDDYVKLGENIKVKVIDSNENNSQLKLSIKDIDYRENDNKNNKLTTGPDEFDGLKSMLDIWIEKKIAKIEKKNNLRE